MSATQGCPARLNFFLTLSLLIGFVLACDPPSRIEGNYGNNNAMSSNTAAKNNSQDHPAPAYRAPVAIVTSEQLQRDYLDSEAWADKKFKNKYILVTGAVTTTTRDIPNDPYITMHGTDQSSRTSVQAMFDDSSTDKLAQLKKGQKVSVVCRCDGKFGNILLKDCQFQ